MTLALALALMLVTMLFCVFWGGYLFVYNSLKGLNLKSESDDFLAPKHWASLSISQAPNYPTYR